MSKRQKKLQAKRVAILRRGIVGMTDEQRERLARVVEAGQLPTIRVRNMFINVSKPILQDDDAGSASDDDDLGFQWGRADGIEFKILVKIQFNSDDPNLCGEIVPYAGSWTRTFEKDKSSWKLAGDDNLLTQKPGNPAWYGPRPGGTLHVDWPCEIYYRKENPFIVRSQPGGVDERDGEEWETNEANDAESIGALRTCHLLLRDEPSCTLNEGHYLKYEFQSYYRIEDPRPFRGRELLASRRFRVFIYGTANALTMTQTLPKGWYLDTV